MVGVGGWVGVVVGSGVAVGARGVEVDSGTVGVGCGAVGVSLVGDGGAGVVVSGALEVRRQASNDKPNRKEIERRTSFWIFMLTLW